MLATRIYGSLVEVTPTDCPDAKEIKKITLKCNEPFSFQIAYKWEDEQKDSMPVYVRINSDLKVNYYYTACVPVMHANFTNLAEKRNIGLYPDVLMPKKRNPEIKCIKAPHDQYFIEKGEDTLLIAYDDSWQSLWFCVNEDSVSQKSGKYNLEIEFYSGLTQELLVKRNIEVELLETKLLPQKLYYTNWFHYDCLADAHKAELFSDEYFEIMSDYLKKASRNGMNMLLLPAFTPPLDTPIGGERMTVQLVSIKYENRKYSFDFSLMKKFIDIAKKSGIKYFEHSHLFSQWGAEATPKIMVTVNGKEKHLFGWHTDAKSPKYKNFLKQYLTALREFLKGEKLVGKVLFHVSDEPENKFLENYVSALSTVEEFFEGYMHSDALWDYSFFEKGILKSPIVSTGGIDKFIGKCDNLWAYYTGNEIAENMSNRTILNTRCRNRILGIMLYYYGIKGFLHWGYNFYYGIMSQGRYDPRLNPCGCSGKAGTSFSVYPSDDGTALQSVRQKVFFDGILDMRNLELLEKLTDKSNCKALIEKYFGVPNFKTTSATPEIFDNFINELNLQIRKSIKETQK